MLKLGTQTNSLTNHLLSQSSEEPVVGMGATLLHWTDRTACTVIEWDGTTITVQEDEATRLDNFGMSDAQTWRCDANTNGRVHKYRRYRNTWRPLREREPGKWVLSTGPGLTIGRRDHYHDFGF